MGWAEVGDGIDFEFTIRGPKAGTFFEHHVPRQPGLINLKHESFKQNGLVCRVETVLRVVVVDMNLASSPRSDEFAI